MRVVGIVVGMKLDALHSAFLLKKASLSGMT